MSLTSCSGESTFETEKRELLFYTSIDYPCIFVDMSQTKFLYM